MEIFGTMVIIGLVILSLLWLYGLFVISNNRKKFETAIKGGKEERIEVDEISKEKRKNWLHYSFFCNFFVWLFILFVITIICPEYGRKSDFLPLWEKAIFWYGIIIIIVMGYLSFQGIIHLRNRGLGFSIEEGEESF